MGAFTHIEWCHHTYNAWRGCWKISPGCANCYAEVGAKRNPKVLGKWGKDATRALAAESYWNQPLAWDKAATKAGERHRVFALSYGDWLEDRPDLLESRSRLLEYVLLCPNLDWLLLSKRLDTAKKVLRDTMDDHRSRVGRDHVYWLMADILHGKPTRNLWLGASVEDRKHGLPRLEPLRALGASVRFLSVEPLLEDLGPIDLTGIDWVIVGGESGDKKARPMNIKWVRSLRDRCQAVGVAFFFKQWGEWVPIHRTEDDSRLADQAGRFYEFEEVPAEWVDCQPHKGWWQKPSPDPGMFRRVGKKASGRLLDGRTWDQLPTPAGSEVAS